MGLWRQAVPIPQATASGRLPALQNLPFKAPLQNEAVPISLLGLL